MSKGVTSVHYETTLAVRVGLFVVKCSQGAGRTSGGRAGGISLNLVTLVMWARADVVKQNTILITVEQ